MTAESFSINLDDMRRCRIASLSARHYRRAEDGTVVCACRDHRPDPETPGRCVCGGLEVEFDFPDDDGYMGRGCEDGGVWPDRRVQIEQMRRVGSRCGIHGTSTAETGRCADCDRAAGR